MHSCRTEVIHALGSVNDIELCRGFQFDQDRIVDQQIDKVFADNFAGDVDSSLLHDGQASFTQFVRKRVLLDLLQKPQSNAFATVNAQPMICFDIAFSTGPFAFICRYK